MKSFISMVAVLAMAMGFVACEDDHGTGHDHDHDHEEAVGVILSIGGNEVLRATDTDGAATMPNPPAVGQTSDVITVSFLSEDGDIFTPDDADFSLGVEVNGTSITTPSVDAAGYTFTIQGASSGTSTINIVLNHDGHVDYRSVPITVVVP